MKFRSRFGQVLTIVTAFTVLLGLAVNFGSLGLLVTLQTLPSAALICYLVWFLFWQPKVEVNEDFVLVVNPFFSYRISFGAIQRIDTKWSLELFGEFGKVSAFAAPAPGRHSSLRASGQDVRHLPESSYVARSVRPGDLPTSDSGAVAWVIRNDWQKSAATESFFVKSLNRKSLIALLALAGAVFITWL